MLIVDEKSEFTGIIARGDLLRALAQNRNGNATVIEAATREVIVSYADEVPYDAVCKIVRNNVGRLPWSAARTRAASSAISAAAT